MKVERPHWTQSITGVTEGVRRPGGLKCQLQDHRPSPSAPQGTFEDCFTVFVAFSTSLVLVFLVSISPPHGYLKGNLITETQILYKEYTQLKKSDMKTGNDKKDP